MKADFAAVEIVAVKFAVHIHRQRENRQLHLIGKFRRQVARRISQDYVICHKNTSEEMGCT